MNGTIWFSFVFILQALLTHNGVLAHPAGEEGNIFPVFTNTKY